MLGAVPTMLVVKNLVSPLSSLELHNEDCLHAGAIAGGGARVNALNSHAFREEIELTHWSTSVWSLSR